MTKYAKMMKVMAFLSMGGFLAQGACLPDNFWSEVWGYTIVDATIAAVVSTALAAVGL